MPLEGLAAPVLILKGMPRVGQEENRWKQAAAEYAAQQVCDGMTVGLGTGTTAEYVIRYLGAQVSRGLDIVGVPTSVRSEHLARTLGIRLVDLQNVDTVHLTIDGADEIEPTTLAVIKGQGGALLREKLVALASERLVIVADRTKLVDRLGSRCAVPVEVVPFGWRIPKQGLARLGGVPTLRVTTEGEPVYTDNDNVILDVRFETIDDPRALGQQIKALPGVIEHGLFVDMVDEVVLGGASGTEVLTATH